MQSLLISQVEFFLCLIYVGFFIELCPIIQQKRRRPDTATYFRRITNNAFYKPAK